jgi:hypothetical protein
MEHYWNTAGRRKPDDSDKNSVSNKSQTLWPSIEPGSPREKIGD